MRVKNAILKLMRKQNSQPLSTREIHSRIGGLGFKKIQIDKALSILASEGKICRLKGKRYALLKEGEILKGYFQANPRGFGFVVTEKKDIYIGQSNLGGALHGDEVLVKVLKQRGKREEGKIIKVVKRKMKKIIGIVRVRNEGQFLIPIDKRIFYLVSIYPPVTLEDGETVVVKIDQYPQDDRIIGRVEEVLGKEDEKGIDIEILLREHNLKSNFPQDVIKECEDISDRVFHEEIKDRKDYRDDFTITIDGLDAKDFDDAVSISLLPSGNFLLKVHIADVSHYVPLNSALDVEASERGFSCYLVDRVLPMLPSKLSNGICSLNPYLDRLSLSVEMEVNLRGEVEKYAINEGVIRSNYRLTYEEVDEAFKSGVFPSKEVEECLGLLRELSLILEKKRLKRGSLNFETVEPKVFLNNESEPVSVKLREKTPATQLIEETMILTNEIIASFLYLRGFPNIYRVHEKPDRDSLLQAEILLSKLGYPAKGLHLGSPRVIQKIIDFAHRKPEKHLINFILLRSMKQARYSPFPERHFGLASNLYSHFTSPIRRYSDLVVHRLTKKALKGIERGNPLLKKLAKNLPTLCEHLSFKEREYDEAERESVEIKLCQLIKKEHLGEVFEGIITGVTNYGLFVELPNTAEGLVHIRNLSGDFYRYEPEKYALRGERTGIFYQLGQKITVRIVNVNVGEKRIDLTLV